MSTVARLIARWITASPLRAVVLAVLLAAGSAVILPAFAAAGEGLGSKPTVVVVHGSSAESASWDKISSRLFAKGYTVLAAANPPRSVNADGAYVAKLLASITDHASAQAAL